MEKSAAFRSRAGTHCKELIGDRGRSNIAPLALDPVLLELGNNSPLAFRLTLTDGRSIETVGHAAAYFSGLTDEQRERSHWKIAIRMLSSALKESAYLKAATLSLQTALMLDNILASPHPLDAQ